ncbi:MAG: metal ABC transporter permease [Clostridia bacterium]|nr:metal ABC transporter permease [Clostridia bacterium]
MTAIRELFSYSFVIYALLGGVGIALCASLLGVHLVLKRFSMLGDGLSHVAFGSAAIALAAGVAPLKISIPVVILAAFLLLHVSRNGKIRGDAAIALVSSSALAIGVIVATLTTGMNTDISSYMFGSILAMSRSDTVIAVSVAVGILLLYVLFYQKLFATTFDEDFAAAVGVRVEGYRSLLAVLTAVTVVVGMRMMGALLISSIITFPALSAMRVCKRYRTVVITAGILSVVAFLIGMAFSLFLDMPAGASIVVVNLGLFLALSAVEFLKKRPNLS